MGQWVSILQAGRSEPKQSLRLGIVCFAMKTRPLGEATIRQQKQLLGITQCLQTGCAYSTGLSLC